VGRGQRGTVALTAAIVTVLAVGPGVLARTTSAQAAPASKGPTRGKVDTHPQVTWNAHHGQSKPLRDATSAPAQGGIVWEPGSPRRAISRTSTPALPSQTTMGTATATTVDKNFTGIVGTAFGATPPDPNIAVGSTQVVEVVNNSIEIWNKTGTVAMAAKATNALWTGYVGTNPGNSCATHNDGDAIVRYDGLADRWIVTQFSLPNSNTAGGPSFQCVAVSQTNDATGAYWLYDFSYAHSINDYGKLGVWSDGYYVGLDMFDASGGSFTYVGAESCVYEKAAMLIGHSARQMCFGPDSAAFTLLPSSVEGTSPPPDGAPDYLIGLDFNFAADLEVRAFHADWSNTALSTLAHSTLPVPAYQPSSCALTGASCVPEPGGGLLDDLSDRLMFPLSYRNTGAHQSLVVSHTVDVGSGVLEPQWYEMRVGEDGLLHLFQSGTFAPADGLDRWMSSAAMDQAGNIALGYSASNATTNPSVRYTARAAGDPAGQMTEAEVTLHAGTGRETGTSRWGDYSSMVVDPVDACTFWYVNESYTTNGSSNWVTSIASLRFTTCGVNDFGLSAPGSLSTRNRKVSTDVTTSVTKGTAENVTLSLSGLPSGATYSFSPPTVSSGGTSTLTVDATSAAVGSYPLTVGGSSASTMHGASLTLSVTDDYSVSVAPSGATLSTPTGVSVTTAALTGVTPTLDLSVQGLPSGATAAFNPTSVTTGGASTLTLSPGTAPAGTYPLTISATDNSLSPPETRTTPFTLTIPDEFSVSDSPTSTTVTAPATATTTITPTRVSGTAHQVRLEIAGLPSGAAASFSVNPVPPGGTSVLTVTPGAAAGGSYPLTVTATDQTTLNAHQTSFTVTINDNFSLSTSPTSLITNGVRSVSTTLTTTRTSGTAHPLHLAVTGLPSGASASYTSNPVTAGSNATVTLTPGSAAAGHYALTLMATDTVTSTAHSVPLSFTIDRTAPTASVTRPASLVTVATSTSVSWTGSDTGSGVAYYDVRYVRAPYSGGFSGWPSTPPSGYGHLTTTSKTVTGLLAGYTYCYEVRATDKAGNTSAWSAQRCTAIPLDDRALAASAGWTRGTGSAYWYGTITRTSTLSRTLTRTGAQLKRVALVFTRCSTCGTVGVYVNGALVGKISTAGTAANKVVVILPAFSYRTGTVTLKVLTSGKPVYVDGLGISRV
jgi:hypothetical protein